MKTYWVCFVHAYGVWIKTESVWWLFIVLKLFLIAHDTRVYLYNHMFIDVEMPVVRLENFWNVKICQHWIIFLPAYRSRFASYLHHLISAIPMASLQTLWQNVKIKVFHRNKTYSLSYNLVKDYHHWYTDAEIEWLTSFYGNFLISNKI